MKSPEYIYLINICSIKEILYPKLKRFQFVEGICLTLFYYMFKIWLFLNRFCSRRLTRIVFARGLFSRARAHSFCSVCEYLKRSGQRGALAAVCTPTIKSASEKHQRWRTSVSEHRERMLWRWSKILDN